MYTVRFTNKKLQEIYIYTIAEAISEEDAIHRATRGYKISMKDYDDDAMNHTTIIATES